MRDRDAEAGAERMCAVTREVKPVRDLVRFVAAPDGALAPDLKCVLPGRGVWIGARAATVREAVKRKVFARALKIAVHVEFDLDRRVEGLMRRRAIDALALANKAGEVVAGFTKVEEALRQGRVRALLHAAEASPDGAAKLDRVARQTRPDLPVLGVFAGDEMDLALGRSNVIHAALVAGRASVQVLERCLALALFREDEGGIERPPGRSPEPPTIVPAGPTSA